jgi:hypothetical protein
VMFERYDLARSVGEIRSNYGFDRILDLDRSLFVRSIELWVRSHFDVKPQ